MRGLACNGEITDAFRSRYQCAVTLERAAAVTYSAWCRETNEEKRKGSRQHLKTTDTGPFLRLSCDPLSLKTFNGPYSMRIFPFSSVRTALASPRLPTGGCAIFGTSCPRRSGNVLVTVAASHYPRGVLCATMGQKRLAIESWLRACAKGTEGVAL